MYLIDIYRLYGPMSRYSTIVEFLRNRALWLYLYIKIIFWRARRKLRKWWYAR